MHSAQRPLDGLQCITEGPPTQSASDLQASLHCLVPVADDGHTCPEGQSASTAQPHVPPRQSAPPVAPLHELAPPEQPHLPFVTSHVGPSARPAQSDDVSHSAQDLVTGWQRGASGDVQSVSARHPTQVAVSRSQSGASGDPQVRSNVQPATQTPTSPEVPFLHP